MKSCVRKEDKGRQAEIRTCAECISFYFGVRNTKAVLRAEGGRGADAGTEGKQSEEKLGQAEVFNDLGSEGSQGEWELGRSQAVEAGGPC